MKNVREIEISQANFNQIAKNYKPLIYTLVRQVFVAWGSPTLVDYEDLHQEALIAIWDSIRLWDPHRGCYFGVYLKAAIYNRLRCYLRDTLPHFYRKDPDKTRLTGKPQFKRIAVSVGSLPEVETERINARQENIS